MTIKSYCSLVLCKYVMLVLLMELLSPVAGDTEKTVRLCVPGTFSALACFTDIAQLSCPDNRTINATSAVYGQYIDPHGFACPNDCCPPNPLYDCTELVYNNAPEDWVTIKLLCDGETDCEFPYNSSVEFRTLCDEGVTPDYVHVFYNCLPRKTFNKSDPRIWHLGFSGLIAV